MIRRAPVACWPDDASADEGPAARHPDEGPAAGHPGAGVSGRAAGPATAAVRAGRPRRRVIARLVWGCGLILTVMEIGWVASTLAAGPAATADAGLQPVVAEPQAPAAIPGSSVAGPAPTMRSGNAAAGEGSVGPGRVTGWAQRLSPQVGIPAIALAAYGSAELTLAAERPRCHLSWAALAGIGSVESNHGRYGGAVLQPDGTSRPPIVGVPLDGHGVAVVRDSDGGRFDGDPVYDRAVGPMQFLPSTWRRYGADGDGDGTANPFSLPDAALAAGRYLCGGGAADLRTARAWSAAVLAYNDSGAYLAEVTARGNAYAVASVTPSARRH